MSRLAVRLAVAAAVALALAALAVPARWQSPPRALAQDGSVTWEWLGWSHFRFTSATGKVILINPFVQNPDSPVKVEDLAKADLILPADGHRDEVGSTVDIAKRTGARTFQPFELGTWLIEQGVPQQQVVRSNPGGRLRMEGITVRMVGSVHGSGLPQPTQTTPYGGPAAGFVITFENGWTVYFAGSTAATQDQALWAEMYKPHMAILPMNGDREPLDFAMQVRLLKTNNPNLSMVIPHHHRVTPQPGQTTVAEVQAAMDAMELGIAVTAPELGRVYSFGMAGK